MAEARILSVKISPHCSKFLLVIIIIEPFSYLLEIISKKSSALYPGSLLNPNSSRIKRSGLSRLLINSFF
jgi:hypothetical protein